MRAFLSVNNLFVLLTVCCIACGSTKRDPTLTVEQKLAIREAQLRVQSLQPQWEAVVANFQQVKKAATPDGWELSEDKGGNLILIRKSTEAKK